MFETPEVDQINSAEHYTSEREPGFRGDWKAVLLAGEGLRALIKDQRPVKYHLWAYAVVVPVGVLLKFKWIEWMVLILASNQITGAENINTAMEDLAVVHFGDGPILKSKRVHEALIKAAGLTVVPALIWFGIAGSISYCAIRRRRS